MVPGGDCAARLGSLTKALRYVMELFNLTF